MVGKLIIVVKSIGLLLIVNSCTYTSVPKCLKHQFGNYSLSTYSIKTDIIHFGGTYIELKKNNPWQYSGVYNYVNHEDTSTTIQYISFFKNGMCANMGTWGTYEIIRDTIKTLMIYRSSYMASEVGVYEKWYKIKDKNTIQAVYVKHINRDCLIESNWLDTTYIFPATHFPTSQSYSDPENSWLINKKWFWKNKKEYKNWKENK